VVAERFVEEGDTVSANSPLLSVVELDPLQAVIHATERDYGRLTRGQDALLSTDAWPGEIFPARIERVAPVFQENTRQARVELRVENADHRLKPGMFIRATVVLERAADALVGYEGASPEVVEPW
jgi:RND family efflux transporter MFP subunit